MKRLSPEKREQIYFSEKNKAPCQSRVPGKTGPCFIS